MTSQLPPGCDSILSIDTNDVGNETIITITFCSGAIQQFSIPHGQDGQDGGSGGSGQDGQDGNGISDISAEQEGDEVTLTITLENGDEVTVTFNIPTAAGAYIVQHNSQGVGAPELTGEFAQKELHNITTHFSVIKGTIPGNTVINAGDTLHWDAVFNITGDGPDGKLNNVFKELFLCLGSNDNITDNCVNLTGQPALITKFPRSTISVHVNVELSKTNSPTREEVFLKGSMHVLDKGENIHGSHSILDLNPPQTQIETVAFYQAVPFDFTAQNFIQLIGLPGGYGTNTTINIDPIYMTVTKIPKI